MAAAPLTFNPEDRGHEHGSHIIEGFETGRLYRGHFNVVNRGCITNLPEDCIIEVPGYVDGNGLNIPIVGDLPLSCAAICTNSINVQRLSVEAAMSGNDTLLRQAMMLDPLTAAVLNPPEIWQLVDDLLIAQEKWLPQYKDAIAAAKLRRETEPRIPTREGFAGAARLHTKTVEEMEADREAATRSAAAADKAMAETEAAAEE
jgi:alpha-galactosidase